MQSVMKIRCHGGGGVDSIFKSADSLLLKLNQLFPVRSDFHKTLQGASAGKYLSRRSGYCYLNKRECNVNQSKNDSFVKRVAKNNN